MNTFPVDDRRSSSEQIADEAALLITCLHGLPFTVPHDTDWATLLRLAEENGVLLLLHQSLLEKGSEMPEFFTAAVGERRDAARTFAAELEDLLEHFAKRGIEVLPLKGPVLASMLYGDAALRQSNDLDILVQRYNYERAAAMLLDIGFLGCSEVDDYHRRFLRNGVAVELHFGIASRRYFPADLKKIWNGSRSDDFRGKPIRVMADDDLILYLCLHGWKHGFSRLIWILDVARALQGLRDCDYEELVRRARQQGQEAWLLMGCEMARQMFPQLFPEGMEAAIAASPTTAARTRRCAEEFFAGDLEIVNDHKIRRFYLQIERSARRRWRCRLSYFAPTPEDKLWAERNRINPALMPMLRPFRLLHKYGASRIWRNLFSPVKSR
jgi:hypothetical protein